MDRINRASSDPTPYDPTQKLPSGPSVMFDPGERQFEAEWLGHLAAGRVGGNPSVSDEARAAMLANERIAMGPRWRG